MHDIAVLDDIFLALKPKLALRLRLRHGPEADEEGQV